MTSDLRGLRNLGPAIEEMLGRVGVATVDDLERVGAAAAYRLLDWRDLPAQVKEQVLAEVEDG